MTEVPSGWLMVMSTAPTPAAAGVVAVIFVLLATTTLVAELDPKLTAAPDWK